MKDKVLIFGGGGFLGQYVVAELLKRSFEVSIADIINPNIENAEFIKCDISKDEDIETSFKNSYKFVYNLAGLANIDDAIKDPELCFNLNTLCNTKKFIEMCRKQCFQICLCVFRLCY